MGVLWLLESSPTSIKSLKLLIDHNPSNINQERNTTLQFMHGGEMNMVLSGKYIYSNIYY